MNPPEPRSPHVLVVDDDGDIREVLSEVIERCGIRTVAAADGAQALTLLREGAPPAAVFLDNWMPRVDGVTVLASMRANPALREIPVVWLSAGCMEPPAGTRPLQKPFEIKAIVAVIESLMRVHPASSPPSSTSSRAPARTGACVPEPGGPR